MSSALKAGTVYFLGVFAFGFVLGTIRVFFVVPTLGETGAVLVETPIMLALSWIVCTSSIKRFAVPASTGARISMGLLAFALLMLAELNLSTVVLGRSLAEHLATYLTAAGAIGLCAQIAFAIFPLLQPERSRLKRESRST